MSFVPPLEEECSLLGKRTGRKKKVGRKGGSLWLMFIFPRVIKKIKSSQLGRYTILYSVKMLKFIATVAHSSISEKV